MTKRDARAAVNIYFFLTYRKILAEKKKQKNKNEK